MATATSTRPPSLLHSSLYGIDFPRRPSSQRPISREPRSHNRSSSALADTRPSATMGFSPKDKVPAGVRRSSSHSRSRTPLPEARNQGPLVLDGQHSPKRSNRFLSTSLQKVKQKRSISGFFSNSDAPSSITMALDMISTPLLAVVHDRPSSAPPIERKRVSAVPEVDTELQNEEKADKFQLKNHFLTKHGRKHHPYPYEAPYMQAYDPVLLDNDRFTEVLLRRLNPNGSPTFHDYGSTPPLNVLDLGCGHGGWVVEAATAWKSFGTKVTGFDLVDVASRSLEVTEASLDNITWVQGNFLNYQLPFTDNSFDLVRMANLSLAIPQDSWFPILSEVRRILALGGRLELIDDQILFPYNGYPSQTSSEPPPHSHKLASSFDFGDDDMINMASPSQDISAEWRAHAKNSEGLETIFESMLLKKYGINPHPQDMIDVVLRHVFGREHTDQIKNMHLALAPVDHEESDRVADWTSRIGSDGGGISQLTSGWHDESMDIGAQYEEAENYFTKLDSECLQLPSHPSGPKPEASTISPKAVDALSFMPDRTESVSTRAVNRFKIYPSMWKGKWSESVRSRRASMESLHSGISESVGPKAAEVLDIAPSDRTSWGSQHSQSSEMKRVEPSGGGSPRGSTSPSPNRVKVADRLGTNSCLSAAQSPGLILWPSTFIPVEPLELEMHACKHMHVLLGCKAALSDFIQDVKSADGRAHISQDELNDLTWEYECFRRKRFNWPAELPNSRMSITFNAAAAPQSPARSDASSGHYSNSLSTDSAFRRPGSSVRSKSSPYHRNVLPSSEPAPIYNRKDLTFVRAFRVYEASKIR